MNCDRFGKFHMANKRLNSESAPCEIIVRFIVNLEGRGGGASDALQIILKIYFKSWLKHFYSLIAVCQSHRFRVL